MSNMHRIHWFDEQIRGGRFPNSSWLAREFEISRRQAQRILNIWQVPCEPLWCIWQNIGAIVMRIRLFDCPICI